MACLAECSASDHRAECGMLAFGILAVMSVFAHANEIAAQSETILDGVTFHQESMVSGVFRCRGTWQNRPSEVATLDNGDVNIYCAFDTSGDRMRFDREQPYEILSRAKYLRNISTKYAKTEDHSIYWKHDSPYSVNIYSPNWSPDFFGKTFDVRILGLGYWGDFTMSGTLPKILAFYRQDKPVDIVNEDNSLVRVVWIYGKNLNRKRTLWVDKSNGYAPVRLEVCYRDGVPSDSTIWPDPCMVSNVAWQQFDGVSVPKSYNIEYRPPRGAGRFTKCELVFDWESLNTTLDDALFTVAGMNLPLNTTVIDNRLGQPIIIGKVGFAFPVDSVIDPGGKALEMQPGGPIEVKVSSLSAGTDLGQRSGLGKALLVLNGIIVGALAVLLLWRWKAKTQPSR